MMMVSFMMKPPFGPPCWTDRSLTVRLVRESVLTSGFSVLFLAFMAGSFQFRGGPRWPRRCPLKHAPCQPWSRAEYAKFSRYETAVPAAQAICPTIDVTVPDNRGGRALTAHQTHTGRVQSTGSAG